LRVGQEAAGDAARPAQRRTLNTTHLACNHTLPMAGAMPRAPGFCAAGRYKGAVACTRVWGAADGAESTITE
jgi:hypothetical protein